MSMTDLSLISHNEIDKDRANIHGMAIPAPSGTWSNAAYQSSSDSEGVATRFEKTARNDLAVVIVAATILWIR
jgi:hypothetical protein